MFGLSFLVVTTGSMEPEINIGELVIIQEKDKYKKDDIVTYLDKDGFLITHRIVEINDSFMITKGDNNNVLDEPGSVETIKGKVIFHSKILGIFILYLLKPSIFVYIITILILNIIKIFFTKEREEKNNEDKKEVENNINC